MEDLRSFKKSRALFGAFVGALFKSLDGATLRLFFFGLLYGPAGIVIWSFGSREVWQMQRQVLDSLDDADAMSFKKSIQEESSIIAVAATIFAQIAITALSLEGLSRTHWMARAFFILSLVSSIIAVYYATKQYRILGRCLSASQVKLWIRNQQEDKPTDRNEELPSVASVITVSAPNMLLSFSLNSFLVGLGIYLGFTWTRALDETAGIYGSRAAFITYVVGLCLCYGIYALSNILMADQTYASDIRLLRKVNGLPADPRENSHHHETGRGNNEVKTQASANTSSGNNHALQTLPISPGRGPSPHAPPHDGATRRELLEVFQEAARLRAASAKVDEHLAQLLEKLVEDDMV